MSGNRAGCVASLSCAPRTSELSQSRSRPGKERDVKIVAAQRNRSLLQSQLSSAPTFVRGTYQLYSSTSSPRSFKACTPFDHSSFQADLRLSRMPPEPRLLPFRNFISSSLKYSGVSNSRGRMPKYGHQKEFSSETSCLQRKKHNPA
jgi:hypothetical protein